MSRLSSLTPQEPMQRGVAFWLARIVFILVGGTIGFWVGNTLLGNGFFEEVINVVYLIVVGVLLGYLISRPIARAFEQVWQQLVGRVSAIPPEIILAAGMGATVALIISVLLNSVLEAIPFFTWYWSILITILLITGSSWFFVANRHLFNFRRSFAAPTDTVEAPNDRARPKIIDTSALIDGRVVDVIEAHFIEGDLLIANFVLGELQHIADSDDPLRRKRGRRGLEVLDRLVQQTVVKTQVIADDVPDAQEVDEKLVKLCQTYHGDLITTDYNLNRVAALQGVKVLNVNQLANAVKATFLPGERLSLPIVKQGREPGQGLAYLEDGTMVVVEDASDLVGDTVDLVVTSNLQTNMGRMIFARPE